MCNHFSHPPKVVSVLLLALTTMVLADRLCCGPRLGAGTARRRVQHLGDKDGLSASSIPLGRQCRCELPGPLSATVPAYRTSLNWV